MGGLALASGSLAEQAGRADPSDESTTIYEAAHFERYEVVTATDMLRRLPGVTPLLNAAESSNDVRGFGSSGDQILINGRRIAGKANEIALVLDRIQASMVERIELIRGISPDIEVRSEGLIVNVVLRRGIETGSITSWQLGFAHLLENETRPVGSLAHGGDAGPLTYVVGLSSSRPTLSRQIRPQQFFAPDGGLLADVREIRQEHDRNTNLTGNLLYRFDVGRELRLNGLVQRRDEALDEPREVFDVLDGGDLSFRALEARRENARFDEWELGGDYQQGLGENARLNVLFVYGTGDEDTEQVQTVQGSGPARLISLEQTQARQREAILRGQVQRPIGRQSIELGAEFARNELDTDFRLFGEDAGNIVEVDIFNSDSLVREDRWEAFVTHHWRPGGRWTLQAALNAEVSTISQHGGDISLSRSFSYLKPRVDFRLDLQRRRQLRIRAERTISQLNFENFVATFDFDDDQVRAGNPELVPEEIWTYEVAYSHRFSDDDGVLDLKVFRTELENMIDRIAIEPTRTARGNLDGGRSWGGELELSLRLSRLNLPDVVVNAGYTYRNTSVPDPLTGERRTFTTEPRFEWNLGFRHDMSRPRVSYGAELSQMGPRSTWEVTWLRHFRSNVEMTAFVEARIAGGMTLSLEGSMLRWDSAERDQIRYRLNRGDGSIRRTEYMFRRATPALTLSLRGTF